MKINLLKGIENIDFKISKHDLITRLNQELEFEIIEEEEEFKTEVLFLPEYSSSLFFEGTESDINLSACETQNKDAEIFGIKIFTKSYKEIKELMKEHSYHQFEEEEEEWGEKRLGFYDALVDFYFEDTKLKSVSWGLE